jgi:hypothetical protein
MKFLLLVPLCLIIMLSLFSALDLGTNGGLTTRVSGFDLAGKTDIVKYYDRLGHEVMYANGTVIGETGWIGSATAVWGDDVLVWFNVSSLLPFGSPYQLFWSGGGEDPIRFKDYGKTSSTGGGMAGFDISGALGMIALVVALMAFGLIIGVKVFGIGTTGGTIAVIGTGYLGLWGVFSVLALRLLYLLPSFMGVFFWFILTTMYTVGIVGEFSGGSSNTD